MHGKTRLGLIGIFVVGGIVVSLSSARLISLSIKRAGTVPDFDPSFATPSIYVFSALEINIAILCACIPIFWPLVTSLAGMNKILVVQEIEIRSDYARDSRGSTEAVGFAAEGAKHGLGFLMTNAAQCEAGKPMGLDGDSDGGDVLKPSKATYTTTKEGGLVSVGLVRSASERKKISKSGNGRKHVRGKSSASSSSKSIAIELGRRISQESQRNLNSKISHHASNGTLSLASSGGSPPERGRLYDGGGERYGHVQQSPTFMASVERAESPFYHVRGDEK